MSASQFHRSTIAQVLADQSFVFWLSLCAVGTERIGLRPVEYLFDATCADDWRDLFDAGLTPYEAGMRMFRPLQ